MPKERLIGKVTAIGIDVGANSLHLVGLDSGGGVTVAEVLPPDELDSVLGSVGRDAWVAIDAPDEQRHPGHLADEALSPKFRVARCAEVALGRRGYWVPWVTPVLGKEAPSWMLTGFRVWQECRRLGLRTIEVYPYAAFRALAGSGSLAKKTTLEGRRRRVELLEAVGVRAEQFANSHDSLDAAVGAVVARDARAGTAENVLCNHVDGSAHDGSSIWLPAPVRSSLAGRDSKRREEALHVEEAEHLVDLHEVMLSLARERPVFHSEADFQHALAWKLQQLVPMPRSGLSTSRFPPNASTWISGFGTRGRLWLSSSSIRRADSSQRLMVSDSSSGTRLHKTSHATTSSKTSRESRESWIPTQPRVAPSCSPTTAPTGRRPSVRTRWTPPSVLQRTGCSREVSLGRHMPDQEQCAGARQNSRFAIPTAWGGATTRNSAAPTADFATYWSPFHRSLRRVPRLPELMSKAVENAINLSWLGKTLLDLCVTPQGSRTGLLGLSSEKTSRGEGRAISVGDPLVLSIARRVRDYQEAERGPCTPEHVERWITQFDEDVQLTILRETDRLLARYYWTQVRITEILRRLVTSRKLFGEDVRAGLAESRFLSLQPEGKSQHDLLTIIDRLLRELYGTPLSEYRGNRRFFYIDDCLFSGDTTVRDLTSWIGGLTANPQPRVLHVVHMARHRTGYEWARQEVESVAKSADVETHFWGVQMLENRRDVTSGELFWPTPQGLSHVAMRYVAELADAYGVTESGLLRSGATAVDDIFTDETSREVLEREFYEVGVRLHYAKSDPQPWHWIRPLGYDRSPTVGFGSFFVCYRNAPNNGPLAFWYGDPRYSPTHPFGQWYPLFPVRGRGGRVNGG
jgi:predicted nuclease with RNAse H fold